MADKRISQLVERVTIANNDVLPIVASGATTTNKVTVSTLQDWMQNNLDVGVTSIGITIGSSGTDINVTGSPVTTSGNITINIPTASATNRGLLSSSDWTTFNNKLSSVGLSMPSAFTVTNSPLTSNGTIAVTGAGTVSQYIRGDGSLADFPEAGGGGASVSYYLNGSVSQGTIGGIAYREMNKTPILGAGTDFTIAADGYIASFITDAGDPSLLEIPGGNWNFESYFQASSGGGSPSFYIELYKVNSGGTATLIASNSANPELIAFGTTTTAYFSTLAVPTTTLALTDRLAVRFYVTHSGRTITMHTENSNLCQVITTFTTGLTALNGLTAQVQNFATGTSGTDFAISSAGSTHTFNLPDASASARGVVTTGSQVFGGVKTFANGLSLSAVGGSNQTTRIVNIGTLHEGTASVNQIGFNSGNNIYFGKGLNNGGVISWNNAAVRYYTLPDADGTIALTSQIPANPVGGTGTTNQIPKFSATSTLTNSNISDNGSDVVISSRTGISLSGQSILITPNLGGTTNRIETTGSLPLAIATSGSSITLAAGGTTPQITLASTGAVTLTGALNGTSASFTGDITASSNAYFGTFNGNDKYHFEPFTNAAGGANNAYFVSGKIDNNERSGFVFQARNSNGEEYNAVIVEGHNSTSTTTALSISSTGAATFSGSVTANTGLTVGSLSSGSNAIITLANNASGSPRTIYYKASDATINFTGTGGTDQVTITNGGNVGIGTASPSQLLHVKNDQAAYTWSRIDNQSTSSSAYSGLQLGAYGNTWGIAIGSSAANSNALTFVIDAGGGNTERMRITSGGYLKASNNGTYLNSSGSYHELRQTNADTVLALSSTNASFTQDIVYAYSTRSASSAFNFITCVADSTNQFRVRGDGVIYAQNTSVQSISDIRTKENIIDSTDGLNIITSLRPVRFDYKYGFGNNKKNQLGFIAQEVEEVFPDIVDIYSESDEIDNPYKSLGSAGLIPVLVKAIQELKAEIDSLKNQIK